MPYLFPGIETLIADAQADITGSDLPNADGFLPRAILPLMAVIQAGFALGHYDAIAYAMQQATPFTATDEWLDAWAALKRVFRKDATAAGVSGTSYVQILNCTPGTDLPAGTQVNRADGFSYTTLIDATVAGTGIVTAPIMATVTGVLGNAASGVSLTLNTSIAGITSAGAASAPITGGADQENNDDLRARMLFAYANPPAGGSATDYVTWTLAVAGVTRAWCLPQGMGAGTVSIFTMLDEANAQWGGFPQGSNGVATQELRAAAAQGDQLTIANALYPIRPVSDLVFSCSPVEEDIAYVIGELPPNTPAIQAAVTTALQSMHLRKAAVGGTTETNGTLYPSDWNEAVAAVPGIAHFAITSPTTAVTPAIGSLLTVGTPTFSGT